MCRRMKENLNQINDFVLQVEKNVEKIKMNVVHIERIMDSKEELSSIKREKRDSHAPTAFMNKRHGETEPKRDSHTAPGFMKKRMLENEEKHNSHIVHGFLKKRMPKTEEKRDSHTAPAFAKRNGYQFEFIF